MDTKQMRSYFRFVFSSFFSLVLALCATAVALPAFAATTVQVNQTITNDTGSYTLSLEGITDIWVRVTEFKDGVIVGGFDSPYNFTAGGGRENITLSGKGNGVWTYRVFRQTYTVDYMAGVVQITETKIGDAVVTVALKPGVPPSVTPSATLSTNGELTINWGVSGGVITAYELEQQVNSGSWSRIHSGTARTKSVSGLSNGSYQYRVRGCNAVNGFVSCSNWTYSSLVTVLNIPGKPSAISAPSTDADGVFSISWGASSGVVESYRLEQKLNSGSWSQIQSGTSRTAAVSVSTDGTYQYRVRACNSSGCSAYTAISSVTVLKIPGVPGIISTSITNSNGVFSLSWGGASGTIESYRLEQKVDSGAWTQIQSGTALTASLSVSASGTYHYRVRACNATGCSGYTATSTVTVLKIPSVPGALTAPATDTDGVFNLSWQAASGTIESYRLEQKIDSGSWSQIQSGAALTASISISSSGTYHYRVRACNTSGCSGYTAAATTVVLLAPGVPGAISAPPTDSDGIFSLTWGAASGPVESYRLEQKINSGSWTQIQSGSSRTASISVTVSGTYQFRVRACNATGCSGYTAASSVNVNIPLAQPTAPSWTSSVSSSDSGNFDLSWSAGSGVISHYQLQQRMDGADWVDINLIDERSYQARNKIPGVYDFRVRACNQDACSIWKTHSVVVSPLPQNNIGIINSAPSPVQISPSVDTAGSDQIGTIDGSFRVDESGAATYEIPIAVPQGTAGVQPQISLKYSSQGGNGLLGHGWSLQGTSAIARCRQTLSQDGQVKPIAWNAQDRFCLDGQRLLVQGGVAYGAVGATYKTEIDSFVIVTSHGGSAGHPAYFTAERKDGSVTTYGQAQDAKQTNASGQVLSWSQSEFKDSIGNKISYVYTKTGGQSHRVQSISYGSSGQIMIQLGYEGRPDIIRGYTSGHSFTQEKRLNVIDIFEGTQKIRSYHLRYRASSSVDLNKISRLTSVQECGFGVCLPESTFTWILPRESYTENFTFEYNGQTISIPQTLSDYGFSSTPTSSTTLTYQKDRVVADYKFPDINGDGFADIAWVEPDYDNDGKIHDTYVKYALFDGTTYSAPVTFYSDTANHYTPYKLHVLDYNADGRSDLLLQREAGSNFLLYLSVRKGDGSWEIGQTPIDLGFSGVVDGVMDVNSDGLIDLLYGNKRRLLVKDTSAGAVSNLPYKFSEAVDLDYGYTQDLLLMNWHYRNLGGDFNGDGLMDSVQTLQEYIPDIYGYPSTRGVATQVKVNTGTSYVQMGENLPFHASSTPPVVGDINGDGLSDLLIYNNLKLHVYLSTGSGFVGKGQLDIPYDQKVALVDYNQDGFLDYIYHDFVAKKLKVLLWNNASESFDSPRDILNTDGSRAVQHLFFDVNNDGRIDYVRFGQSALNYFAANGSYQPWNLIASFRNGLGAETSLTYGAMSASDHYTDETDFASSTSEFYSMLNAEWNASDSLGKLAPVLAFKVPIYLVNEVSSSAPTQNDPNAKSSIRYYYQSARMQAAGRGYLGFKKLTTFDPQTFVATTTEYRQDWPFIGYPQKTTKQFLFAATISESINTWNLKNYNSAWKTTAKSSGSHALGALQPFISSSDEKTYDVVNNGATQGALLQQIITTNAYDGYGNALSVDVQTKNGQGAVVARKLVQSQYGATTWEQRMGRLSTSTVTTTRGNNSQTRKSGFTYYTAGVQKGLLHKEIIEPDVAEYRMETTYEYDNFGNKIKVTQAAPGEESRVLRTEYESTGRFVTATFNSYGQRTSAVLSRNVYGLPTEVVDINGVSTKLYYSARGNKYFESSATGAWTQTLLSQCDGKAPAGCSYMLSVQQSGGAQSKTYYDRIGRIMRTGSRGFDGIWAYADTQYDSVGRVARKSEPYSGSAQYWTTFEYDALGRVIRSTLPGVSQAITAAYNGLTTVATNPLGQAKTEVRNVLGELVSVKDAMGGRIQYEYDAQGNLTKTINQGSPANPHNVVISVEYDGLGRKIAMNDPDKGQWLYTYNHFGELVGQQDAKGQLTTMSYDRLGRLVGRVDYRADNSVEGNTTWTYRNGTSGFGLAALSHVEDSVSGYLKVMEYDRFGRVSETATSFAANDDHYEKVTYDQFGRVFQVFDAAGNGNWQNSAIQNVYNNAGYLHKVVDALHHNGQPLQTYYTVETMDLRGNVTKAMHGNGVVTQRYYDPATGRLQTLNAGLAVGLGAIQDQTYQWDALGNLLNRRDQSGSKNLQEAFTYDALNRLKSAQVTGRTAQTLDYDSVGNITRKSDVGTYRYGSQCATGFGPHAVCETSDGIRYSYDANGNLTSDTAAGGWGGRTIKYTTFDKPYEITKAGHATHFKYGPDRARFMRTDTKGSDVTVTRYVGSVEKVNLPNGTREVKRYIGDILVTITQDNSGNVTGESTRYLFKDHLGSVDVIVDALGSIEQELSFDAWGQRRSATDWSQFNAASVTSFNHSITTRGFTGHEMLDEVGLVHMNGRIYDARLGRFLQADPHIDGATDTQGYNRYSYVGNNPLSYTDPSGYFKLRQWVGAIVAVVGGYICGAPCAQLGWQAVALGAAAGAAGAAANGGNVFQGAVIGAISGAAFSGVAGTNFSGLGSWAQTAKMGAYGAVGGVTSVLQGGKFGHGFVSAGFSAPLGGTLARAFGGGQTARFVSQVIVGGTLSEATGGKFANGAGTAAFMWALSAGANKIAGGIGEEHSDLRERQAAANSEIDKLYEDGMLKENHLFEGEGGIKDAAGYVLEQVSDISERYKLEIAGTIEPVEGGITYSKPSVLGRHGGGLRTGSRTIAGYHTHTSEHTSIFSIDDTVWVNNEKMDLYMRKTTTGNLRVCQFSASSCNARLAQDLPSQHRPRTGVLVQ